MSIRTAAEAAGVALFCSLLAFMPLSKPAPLKPVPAPVKPAPVSVSPPPGTAISQVDHSAALRESIAALEARIASLSVEVAEYRNQVTVTAPAPERQPVRTGAVFSQPVQYATYRTYQPQTRSGLFRGRFRR